MTDTIEDFVRVRGNGCFDRTGALHPGIPLMEQVTNPAYQYVGYRWVFAGKEYRLTSDGCQVMTAALLPNARGIAVLESSTLSAPDNLRILWPDGSMRQRLRNPYLDTKAYQAGDEVCFLHVAARDGNLYTQISVVRRAGHGQHPAMPLYDAMWNPDTLNVLSLQWRPWD